MASAHLPHRLVEDAHLLIYATSWIRITNLDFHSRSPFARTDDFEEVAYSVGQNVMDSLEKVLTPAKPWRQQLERGCR